jgi:hypothetical protein
MSPRYLYNTDFPYVCHILEVTKITVQAFCILFHNYWHYCEIIHFQFSASYIQMHKTAHWNVMSIHTLH